MKVKLILIVFNLRVLGFAEACFEFGKKLALAAVEIFGNLDYDVEIEVALAVAPEVFYALAAKLELRARLRACGNGELLRLG